jgi:hypothetical protein
VASEDRRGRSLLQVFTMADAVVDLEARAARRERDVERRWEWRTRQDALQPSDGPSDRRRAPPLAFVLGRAVLVEPYSSGDEGLRT